MTGADFPGTTGWHSKFLDLTIKEKGTTYEINIPAGYVTRVIPLSG